MKRTHWIRSMAVMTVMTGIVMPVAAAAQHAGHQTGSAQTASPAIVADCARAQPQVMQVIDAANSRVEAARQGNSALAMRAAVDDLQGALGQLRAQLAPCAALQTAAPAAPMDHSKMPMGGAPAKGASQPTAMDPVTGLMVDPKTAPKTTYQGHTYYFSSEQARAEFLENPAKFAANPKELKPKP